MLFISVTELLVETYRFDILLTAADGRVELTIAYLNRERIPRRHLGDVRYTLRPFLHNGVTPPERCLGVKGL